MHTTKVNRRRNECINELRNWNTRNSLRLVYTHTFSYCIRKKCWCFQVNKINFIGGAVGLSFMYLYIIYDCFSNVYSIHIGNDADLNLSLQWFEDEMLTTHSFTASQLVVNFPCRFFSHSLHCIISFDHLNFVYKNFNVTVSDRNEI